MEVNKSPANSLISKTVPLGPEPTLLTRKEMEALYSTLEAVKSALDRMEVPYIITGGSLLGAVRQHSILFCDDDIDIALVGQEHEQKVQKHLQHEIGPNFHYTVRPWEGGDRVRPKHASNVFLDIFTLRQYTSYADWLDVVGTKTNGQPQTPEYVEQVWNDITKALAEKLPKNEIFPFWQFNTRKAMDLWRKEVYREYELYPLVRTYKMGPLTNIQGPHMPIRLLKRAFGHDCFHVYVPSHSHGRPVSKTTMNTQNQENSPPKSSTIATTTTTTTSLAPHVLAGGTWQGGQKIPLQDEHYLPIQPIRRAQRRFTLHNKEGLFDYIQQQEVYENQQLPEQSLKIEFYNPKASKKNRPRRTVYMDGVFDLFHVGHLHAIQQCAQLGDVVIIGVTGDEDAAGYKRPPIINQKERCEIIAAIQHVNQVICPCPLEVTQHFLQQYQIDLVVHGFANPEDAQYQKEHFFAKCIQLGKFQEISYDFQTSTTDIIAKIQSLP